MKKSNEFDVCLTNGKKFILLLFIFFLIIPSLVAQQKNTDLQDQLEDFIESSFSDNESLDVEQLLAELQEKAQNPYNINQVTSTELASLYFLNQAQINNLLKYRELYGQIFSIYELAAIDGFDQQTIKLLGNFVTFGESGQETRSSYREHEVLLREIRLLEKQAGYLEPRKYEGSPDKFYLRYRYESATIKAGLTSEKDAGESFFKNSNAEGFDFYSGFLTLDLGEDKPKIYLGDYVVRYGQGLVIWQGFSLGKSSEVTQVAKLNQGIRNYSSTDENNYLRGMGASVKLGKFQFSPFLSYKNFDANTDSVDDRKVFTSFQTSGYHRTSSEIEDKNSTSEFVAGGNLSYNGTNLSVGITGVYFKYQYPLNRRDALYNRYLFGGDHISNLSADYKWAVNNVLFFGEFSSSFEKGVASLNGVLLQPFDRLQLAAIYRNIGKRYNAPLSSALTENSRVNDEQGLYLGATIFPVAKLSLDFYADFFSYQWVKYTTAAPGKGQEFLMQANYSQNETWDSFVRYKYERKPVKITRDGEKENLDQIRQSLRFQIRGEPDRNFTSKSRIEFSFYKHDHQSSGILISQDIGYHPEETDLSMWARVAWFKTDDYDSRIYEWENDMLYQFSIPAFYGEGFRFYVSGKVKICEKTDFWFKASQSWLYNEKSLSSGYNRIDGNKRTELKAQLRFRF